MGHFRARWATGTTKRFSSDESRSQTHVTSVRTGSTTQRPLTCRATKGSEIRTSVEAQEHVQHDVLTERANRVDAAYTLFKALPARRTSTLLLFTFDAQVVAAGPALIV